MLKKTFEGNCCYVEFSLPQPLAAGAHEVYLLGDFNQWSHTTPMLRDGDTFKVEVPLEVDREYEFLYLVDGQFNQDWNADKYIPNPYRGDNAVVVTCRFE